MECVLPIGARVQSRSPVHHASGYSWIPRLPRQCVVTCMNVEEHTASEMMYSKVHRAGSWKREDGAWGVPHGQETRQIEHIWPLVVNSTTVHCEGMPLLRGKASSLRWDVAKG